MPKGFEDKRAIAKEKEKISKYNLACKQRGVTFVPFVMYSTGKIHKGAMRFLKKLATHATDKLNIPTSTLLNFYIKMINFALIREATRIICSKCDEIDSINKGVTAIERSSANYVTNQLVNEIVNPPIGLRPVG